jgi:glucokinase
VSIWVHLWFLFLFNCMDTWSHAMNGPIVAATAVHCIGIDVGGTKIAAGLIAFPEGQVLAKRIMPTQPARGGRAVLNDVLRMAREIAAEAAAVGQSIQAIGLGVCELVDGQGRITSANCIQWVEQPVHSELSTIAPAIIDADVRAAALAEALFGAGKPFRTFLYVTIGTGISCCLMLDGQPYLGAHGATGTMASSPLSVPCESCGHINRRTLEEIASGPALVARFDAGQGQTTKAQEVLAAAAAGNTQAIEIVHSGADALGSQIGLLMNVLDPEAVVIGGGLGLSEGLYWDRVIASTRRHIWSCVHRDLPILHAATGADAGWIGAAAKAWQELGNQA